MRKRFKDNEVLQLQMLVFMGWCFVSLVGIPFVRVWGFFSLWWFFGV